MFICNPDRLALVKARDQLGADLARTGFPWELDAENSVTLELEGNSIPGLSSGKEVPAVRDEDDTCARNHSGSFDGSVARDQCFLRISTPFESMKRHIPIIKYTC